MALCHKCPFIAYLAVFRNLVDSIFDIGSGFCHKTIFFRGAVLILPKTEYLVIWNGKYMYMNHQGQECNR